MLKKDQSDHPIIKQIYRAIALNREPGLHFCGNFFALSFDEVRAEKSVLHIDAAPYTCDDDGQMNIAVFALLADMGLATGIREKLSRSTRLATVSLSLQLTCEPRVGKLIATSKSNDFLHETLGKQGLSDSRVYAGDKLIAFGTGAFMVLPAPGDMVLHPIAWIDQKPPQHIDLDLSTLSDDEQWIIEHAEKSLHKSTTKGGGFLNHFLGFHPQPGERSAYSELVNGPHIGNRVGHVQGGITLGLAMVTASASLSHHWKLTGVTASYISPGEGATISARSAVVHRGRLTAVVHTEVLSSNGRKVLEVMTTHASRANETT